MISAETSNDTLSHNSKKVAISDVHLLLNDPDVLRQIDQQIEEENSCVEQPDSGLVEAVSFKFRIEGFYCLFRFFSLVLDA